jgi:CDP-diacylglycerol---serine O-phosphatidyltransferase
MAENPGKHPAEEVETGSISTGSAEELSEDLDATKIYLLPNLMTAGNLFCGFVAVIRCIQALYISQTGSAEFLETGAKGPQQLYEQAVWFILAAVFFDSLDGRMARLTGKESAFGKEFDSLADVVSFGMAPALLIYFFLLNPGQAFPVIRTLGAIVGFVYLLCAAVRLARFNVLTAVKPAGKSSDDFLGLPVPAAAGMVASLVLMVNRQQQDFPLLALGLPVLLVIISLLMVSNLRYPSFKSIGAARLGFRSFILLFIVGVGIYFFHYIAVAGVFFVYIAYGLLRGLRSRRKPVGESE